ncbi:MAG: hypothetical protein IPH05_18325 [Flavobacteriales bacterium]|nr:hypothetical protein [Flavobacteriales bacterium]MBK6550624.1 hypothetical protein [Flavobacteriales bacterium]MBK6884852.1 hypothetical protein [Flavobacteriales bacterium]MBK7112641.1 hypothetical protein [Flavobacteriales bacterium]MBK7483403.1 hypothetical protein [Flavobacteriales bacterium]
MPLQRNTLLQRVRRGPGGVHQHRAVEGAAKEQTWPSTWMVFGLFVLMFSFWWVGIRTLQEFAVLARWLALFCFVGNLLPYKRIGLGLGMERLEWFLFNLLAVGPFLFSGLLWLNMLVHGPERLRILRYDGTVRELRNYWSERGQLPPSFEEVPDPDRVRGLQYGERLLGTAKGMFGYEVVSTWERPDGWSD